MLLGLKLAGKNGRNRLGEYPNPRRNGEIEGKSRRRKIGGNKGREKRTIKEEDRRGEKETDKRRKTEPHSRGQQPFTPAQQKQRKAHQNFIPHGHSISSFKGISHLKNSGSDAYQMKNLVKNVPDSKKRVTRKAYTSVLQSQAIGPK